MQFDAPAFKAAFAKAGVKASINNALNDPLKQKAQAQACLAAGAKVVIETSLDNGSAASIEKLFTSKGGKAIDYDRLVIGGSASVYVSFDGTSVGRAQASGVIAAMKAKGTYKASSTIAQLWGGQTDQNAFWFKSGNDAVFNPLFKSKKLKKGPQKFVPDWDANNAATIFSQMLVKTSNNIQGVIAANDNIAGAVIADLKAKHLKPIPLSGQDASVQGVQYILAGWQTGTVYKYVPDEANAAAAAAIALLKGQKPKTTTHPQERHEERADRCAPGRLDHEGELQAPLHGQVPEEERRVHRRRTRSTASSDLARPASGASFGAPPTRLHPDERHDATPRAPQPHQVVRLGAGTERRRHGGEERRGDGARRRQRRRQVDAHQMHRRDALGGQRPDPLRGP